MKARSRLKYCKVWIVKRFSEFPPNLSSSFQFLSPSVDRYQKSQFKFKLNVSLANFTDPSRFLAINLSYPP